MKYLLCLLFISAFFSISKGQAVEHLPVQFGQFFNMYSVINPASCGSTANVEVQLGRQQHGGSWKNISTTYASASIRVKKIKSNNFHVGGLSFTGDREGQYLKRSKLYITYAWHTRLTKQISLGAGASAGFFSYVVSASNASVAGGSTAPDASFGLWLYSKAYYVGVSMNQILNSKVTPLEETTKLVRHFNVTGGYTFNVNKSLSLTTPILIRYAPGYNADVDFATIATINKIISLGVNYRHHKSIVPVVGFQRLAIGKGNLQAMFSYAFPAGKIADNIQTYELTLNYDFEPKKKTRKK